MKALFYAKCIKSVNGLVKGNRYRVTEVIDNKFILADFDTEFSKELFEPQNAYFSMGKSLPTIGETLKDCVRFNGKEWEEVVETSVIKGISLLNATTFLLSTHYNVYIYQLKNEYVNFNSYLFDVNTLPLYLAIGREKPSQNATIKKLLFLDKDNAWKYIKETHKIVLCNMLSLNTYLIITDNSILIYILQ